jgi:hypothetical protein
MLEISEALGAAGARPIRCPQEGSHGKRCRCQATGWVSKCEECAGAGWDGVRNCKCTNCNGNGCLSAPKPIRKGKHETAKKDSSRRA